jgi:hypothetical protein
MNTISNSNRQGRKSKQSGGFPFPTIAYSSKGAFGPVLVLSLRWRYYSSGFLVIDKPTPYKTRDYGIPAADLY